jgi:hypothetical protein
MIAAENQLAYEMLKESATNKDIKQALHEISVVLIAHVLKPIRATLNRVKTFSELDPTYQQILINLAAEHSLERRKDGAALPEFATSEDITNSMSNMNHLIDTQEKIPQHIDHVNTVDEIAVVLHGARSPTAQLIPASMTAFAQSGQANHGTYKVAPCVLVPCLRAEKMASRSACSR